MSPTSRGMLSPIAHPSRFGTTHPVDAAVVLLIQQIGRKRMQRHAVRVVTVLRMRVRAGRRQHAGVQQMSSSRLDRCFRTRRPSRCRSTCASGIAWIDQDRMDRRTVGIALLHVAGPFEPLRMIVPSGHRLPRGAARPPDEQPFGRRARIPHTGFVGMSRRQPEHLLDGRRSTVVLRFGKRRRSRRLPPRAPEVRGTGTPSGRGDRCAARPAACVGRADRRSRDERCGREIPDH